MQIRKLTTADLSEFRRIRLEGLRLSPAAFGSRWEKEQAESDDYFLSRLRNHQVWGIFVPDDELSGIAAFYMPSPDEGVVCSVYLSTSLRGSGAAERLMRSLINDATNQVSRLSLMVNADNVRAIRLYKKLGFNLDKSTLPHAIISPPSTIPQVTITDNTQNNTQKWALVLKPRQVKN
ncbi:MULTISPECIES: GNAT family N-acetyltransferase [Dickeya]|uniref:Acetyltransferase, GNAT family n=1 Tax=Dickeya aquatica TaxID=1401087 RepID=A0A375A8N5_9GAMM|nr:MULTISPECIES: GNAT family N-acetyltransferase [Dickeya]SLM61999.1 Acetyltransferase, GNAT family [Dickeya aquatica]